MKTVTLAKPEPVIIKEFAEKKARWPRKKAGAPDTKKIDMGCEFPPVTFKVWGRN
jgi:hypothetical protein